jgi:hypothetical protein
MVNHLYRNTAVPLAETRSCPTSELLLRVPGCAIDPSSILHACSARSPAKAPPITSRSAPSHARNATALPYWFCEPINPTNLVSTAKAPEGTMPPSGIAGRLSAPRISEEKERYLVGLPFFMDYGVKSFHQPWAIFERAIKPDPNRIPRRVEPERFYQFSSWLEDDETNGLFILCALDVEPPSEDGELSRAVQQPRRASPLRPADAIPLEKWHITEARAGSKPT